LISGARNKILNSKIRQACLFLNHSENLFKAWNPDLKDKHVPCQILAMLGFSSEMLDVKDDCVAADEELVMQ
jgi:hypothetical protein